MHYILRLFIILFWLILALFWMSQILSLMSMKDEEFPGRYDKVIWAIIMSVTLFVGAIVFWWWKPIFSQQRRERELEEKIGADKPS